jgi:CheY-specific phosphatase CheX
MRDIIIKSVKNYSDVYFSEKLDVVDKFVINDCQCSKIIISGVYTFEVLLYISDKSLIKICEILFGMCSEDLKIDLLKEIVNIIAGNVQTNLNKDLTISTPEVCNVCEIGISNGIYFKNDILKMAISLKKV